MGLKFSGKNVLVTGSSMGIGQGLSKCFAEDGANLALADHPGEKERLEKWAEELRRTYGIQARTFLVDLTDADGPERLHREVTDALGEIHTLVNNAGLCWFGNFPDMPLERLEKIVLLNCMAYAKLSLLFLPSMIGRNDGGILNVSSVSAFQPVPTLALYAGTKAFTQYLTEAIRSELPEKSRVTVSTLNPPFTRTHLIEDAGVPLDFIPIKISFMSVDEVTAQGFKAFKKGKDRFVPGLHNRIFYFGLTKFMPHGILTRLSRLLTRRLSDFLPRSIAVLLDGSK
jgi:uncharacterized protein